MLRVAVKVLVLGSDSSIGHGLCELFLAQEAIDCIALAKSNIEDAGEAVVKHTPDFVVNCYTPGLAYIGAVDDAHVQWIEALTVAVVSVEAALVHISSSQIFDGCKEAPYVETDEINATNDAGSRLYHIEKIIQSGVNRACILRSGWVFGSNPEGFLDRLLTYVESGREIKLQADLDGAPTPAEDLARVINTVVWQLYYGADCWGVYHYSGSEVTSSMAFTDTLIALASQYGEVDLDGVQLIEVDNLSGQGATKYPLLDCKKILEAFGVKQRAWRSALTTAIKKRYQSNSDSAD
ncbi:MAG: dTDP-4-dehydrorhamnose reductase [Porticoccus sp.]|jgi:dTDP-4-dehydrorhamnose reductase